MYSDSSNGHFGLFGYSFLFRRKEHADLKVLKRLLLMQTAIQKKSCLLCSLYNELYFEEIEKVNNVTGDFYFLCKLSYKHRQVMTSLQSVEENPSGEHCKSQILTWIKHNTIKETSLPSFFLSPLHLFFCLQSQLF